MKQYLAVKENKERFTHLKVETYYNKGGMNYFTYKNEPRGYYLSVVPVERLDRGSYITESVMAFSGTKELVKEVTRKSDKAMREAEHIAEQKKQSYIDYILYKHNLELA